MRCRRGGDVMAGGLIYGLTVRRNIGLVLD
jgi:hypothetical protein